MCDFDGLWGKRLRPLAVHCSASSIRPQARAFFIIAWVNGGITSRGWLTKAWSTQNESGPQEVDKAKDRRPQITCSVPWWCFDDCCGVEASQDRSATVRSAPKSNTRNLKRSFTHLESKVGLVNGSPSAGSGLSTKSILKSRICNVGSAQSDGKHFHFQHAACGLSCWHFCQPWCSTKSFHRTSLQGHSRHYI